MINRNVRLPGRRLAKWQQALAATTGIIALVLTVISCGTVHRAVVVLPEVPGRQIHRLQGVRTVPRQVYTAISRRRTMRG